ncbi:hypothetical protein EDB81DRAFT_654008, partial [Dactylonectria macrodidyma]
IFPLFPRLPTELKHKIWEASYPKPGMHIFDICVQPRQPFTEVHDAPASETPYDAYADRVFLNSVTITPGHCHGASGTTFSRDPSAYRTAIILSITSVDSAKVTKASIDSGSLGSPNVVYLPRMGKRVIYDNGTDVLCLRFSPSHQAVQDVTNNVFSHDSHPGIRNDISRILEAEWCEGMAAALFNARRLAIDMSELWSPSGLDPMSLAYLSCCIQNDLEVLYLVDYCVGRCGRCWKGELRQKDLVTRKCSLARELDPEDREMDVIYESTITYRQISNLEKLGWDSDHSIFALAKIIADTIRAQQGPDGPFRSVRILICEEEMSNMRDKTISTMCIENYG